MPTLSEWIECRTKSGKPLPRAKCNRYREMTGGEPLHDAQPQSRRQEARQPATPKQCSKPPGPGTHLQRILKSLGFKDCGLGCSGWAAKMDHGGPQWCREHRQEIVGRLQEKREAAGWLSSIKGAGMAVLTGLAFQIDFDHPIEWLVDEAIRRAEEDLAAKADEQGIASLP